MFHDARRGDPVARAPLIALASNPQIPAIVRATAQSERGRMPAIATEGVIRLGLDDPDPIMRIAALRNISPQPPKSACAGRRSVWPMLSWGCGSRPPRPWPTSGPKPCRSRSAAS